MTLAKHQLLDSLKDAEYRAAFVEERVKASIALQIRALREQRNKMTQKQLGTAIGMAQTWVSKLENPEYGKMTVATLLRLATSAFDTDLEIKFRPFSETLRTLPTQGPEYFNVPSFEEELPELERQTEVAATGANLTTPPDYPTNSPTIQASLTLQQMANANDAELSALTTLTQMAHEELNQLNEYSALLGIGIVPNANADTALSKQDRQLQLELNPPIDVSRQTLTLQLAA